MIKYFWEKKGRKEIKRYPKKVTKKKLEERKKMIPPLESIIDILEITLSKKLNLNFLKAFSSLLIMLLIKLLIKISYLNILN